MKLYHAEPENLKHDVVHAANQILQATGCALHDLAALVASHLDGCVAGSAAFGLAPCLLAPCIASDFHTLP